MLPGLGGRFLARKALREARRKARTKTPELSIAFRASSSAKSAFLSSRERFGRRAAGFRNDLRAEFVFLFTRGIIEATLARVRFFPLRGCVSFRCAGAQQY